MPEYNKGDVEQQLYEEHQSMIRRMWDKGYRYVLIPQNKSFAPLYVKSELEVGMVMEDYIKDGVTWKLEKLTEPQ